VRPKAGEVCPPKVVEAQGGRQVELTRLEGLIKQRSRTTAKGQH
jgi:hypothetical protein